MNFKMQIEIAVPQPDFGAIYLRQGPTLILNVAEAETEAEYDARIAEVAKAWDNDQRVDIMDVLCEALANKIVLSISDPFMEPWTADRLAERNAIRRVRGEREAATFDTERGAFPAPYWRPGIFTGED